MTIASFISRRRRLLLFCAATVVLHGLAIDWAASHLAASTGDAARPPVVTAQLRLALPARPPAASAPLQEIAPLDAGAGAAAAPPADQTPMPASARQAPLAIPAQAQAGAAITPIASDASVPALDAADPALAVAPAPGAASAPAAGQASSASPAALAASGLATLPGAGEAASTEPVPQAARRYKVQLPPSATFEMDVARVDADGTKWTGSAVMTWHTDGSRYRASVEAGVSLLVTRLNLLVLRSEGTIDDYGIAPDRTTEKRARRSETATHFNRGGADAGTISFSASGSRFPLLAGAQDKATVPFQLAGIGQADVNQLAGDIDIQVGEDKTASMFRFQLVGEDELETRMGKLVTWHLTRPPKPGTYSSRLDIWLAPAMQWYPVQMRNTEASGALTTQTISRITMTGQ
ncbi:hypothetical protein ASF61_12910 [Duganella sp. Leaf126]|uniref:DUF3108 domain-containing protein n=1 Tax=Duganella sp. Leaf126 TaxID=1736266 RepID=UPI0006F8599B|nr:DUF3108 domain-containing protein [Duganella sp. Leaf126]KQQ32982.1 hypothetical protein ASF61_12910 [Duganella sp. Leaf126]